MRLRQFRLPRHLIVAGSAWLSRALTAITLLASIRILMDSLGLDNYAVFALLTGLIGWFMLADLGIGVSLQNHISESRARNENYNSLIAASGLLAILLLILTIIAMYYFSPSLGPFLLKNFPQLSTKEKTDLFFLTGALSISVGIGGIVYKIWFAEQRGYLSNLLPAIANLVGLGGLLFVKQAPQEVRLYLSLVAFIAPTAILPLVAMVMQQIKAHKLINWNKKNMENILEVIYRLIKRGFNFWLLAIFAAGVLHIDYIVISQFLGPDDIAVYYISSKIFGLVFFVYSAVLLSLWPIFTEAISKRNWALVKRYATRYLSLGLFFMLISTLVLVFLMPVFVEILAPNKNINIPFQFILLLGFYQTLRVWTDTFSMILQSCSNLRYFYIFIPIQASLCFGIQWILTPIYGIYGIVIGLIISFLLTAAWFLPVIVWREYMRGNSNQEALN